MGLLNFISFDYLPVGREKIKVRMGSAQFWVSRSFFSFYTRIEALGFKAEGVVALEAVADVE